MPHYSKVAGGTIVPHSFVKLSTTVEGRVLQCGAGDQIFGIVAPWTRRTPYGALDDGNAALITETVTIFGPPEESVKLRIGGTVTRGDRLKSDASGFGVTTTSANDEIGAIALDSGASGDVIPVQLIAPQRY